MIERYISNLRPSFSPEIVLNVRDKPPLQFYEALLWEYGLTDFLVVANDIEKVIKEAAKFSKIKGSKASIHMALTWVGITEPVLTRLTNTDYEIDPGFEPSELAIKKILVALDHSVQARGILKRIYHGSFEKVFE